MIGRVIGYLLTVFISAYLFFMYDGYIWTGLLLLECLYPVCSFLYLRTVKKQTSVSFGRVPSMGERGKPIRAAVVVKNTSRFGNIKYTVCIHVKQHASHGGLRRKLSGMAAPVSTQTQQISIESEYAGMTDICLDTLFLYDMFGIFRRKIPLQEIRSVGIMPPFDVMPLEVTRRTREFIADADEYSTERHGDDPGEIYQVREYRPPDPVRMVHWKLSARGEDLIVKEHSLPLGCVVLLWVHLSAAETDGAGLNRMLEQAASLSITLFEEKCIHMAAWFEEKSGRVIKWRVDSPEAVYEWIWRLLSAKPVRDGALEQSCFEDAFRGEHFSSIVVLGSDGSVTVNGKTQTVIQV